MRYSSKREHFTDKLSEFEIRKKPATLCKLNMIIALPDLAIDFRASKLSDLLLPQDMFEAFEALILTTLTRTVTI